MVEIEFHAVSRRRVAAEYFFGYLRFQEQSGYDPLGVDAALFARYAAATPTVLALNGTEISLAQHMNQYGGPQTPFDYGAGDQPPDRSGRPAHRHRRARARARRGRLRSTTRSSPGTPAGTAPRGVDRGGAARHRRRRCGHDRERATRTSRAPTSPSTSPSGTPCRATACSSPPTGPLTITAARTGPARPTGSTRRPGPRSARRPTSSRPWARGRVLRRTPHLVRRHDRHDPRRHRAHGRCRRRASPSPGRCGSTSVASPTGGAVQLVRGDVDYAGTAAPRPTPPCWASRTAAELASDPTFALPADDDVFVRTQVVTSSGAVVGFGQPIWQIREEPTTGVPTRRRVTG